MKSKKIMYLLTMLIVVALLLSACSKSDSESTSSEDEGKEKVTSETNDSTEEANQETESKDELKEKVKIIFWHNYGADKETPFFQDTIMPMFNEKYPYIEVEVIAQGNDQYREQIVISAGTKTTPDVARLDITDVAGLAQIGALMPLDDMQGFNELKDTLFEGPMSTNLYRDNYYALPLGTNCKAAVYNMAALEAIGLTDIPATMEEFIEASRKMGNGYTINVSSAGEWDFMPYFWLFGGVLTDEGFNQASGYLDSQQSIDAVNELKALHDEGIFTIKEIDGTVDAWDGIKSGEYALFFEGPWFFAFTSDWEELGLKPALIPSYNGYSASVVGGESIGIFTTSEHPEEAYTFVKFLLSEEVQTLMGREMGQMPVQKVAAKDEKLIENPVWKVYLEQLGQSNTRIPSPQSPAIQQHLKDAFDSILRGEMTTEDGLREAALLIDDELSK